MKRAWHIVWLITLTAAVAGCNKKATGTVTLPDEGPARMQEALRLGKEGDAARKAGKRDQAIKLYEQSLQYERLMPVAHSLGALYLERGDKMMAVQMLQDAADLEPKEPRSYYNIGLIYLDNGQPDKAHEFFLKALERDPYHVPSLRGAAKSGKMRLVSDREALERMKTALLLEKDPAWRKVFEEEKVRIEGAIQSTGSAGRF